MEPFIVHTGKAVPLDRANVDTDAIIPKQFLKRIERTGFGQFLFYDWRYKSDNVINDDFILNHPQYDGATVLIARQNFGCGSSREHAPWALLDYGFRVIIAPSFADIFYNNCFKNGILPIVLTEKEVDTLFTLAQQENGQLTIDLEAQTVNDQQDFHAQFDIDEHRKTSLLKGLDDIGRTLLYADEIEAFEQKREQLI
ncbi:3-isopropylmalate dehydratase small subunit [Caldalkalibacillus salinus]|uniref:3-isopropylmalate dehydratase small subunit n=1 Tax=Caldalkalibacillus salinus TaxID=2803787 RepID=UPI00192447C4|nr:3-isopropylmalate dehydratase small subunit [Caldalkalibacillus salinus]